MCVHFDDVTKVHDRCHRPHATHIQREIDMKYNSLI